MQVNFTGLQAASFERLRVETKKAFYASVASCKMQVASCKFRETESLVVKTKNAFYAASVASWKMQVAK